MFARSALSQPCLDSMHNSQDSNPNPSQLTPQEQCKPHCSNPNPNPYPLPNHYLTYIVCLQILQQILFATLQQHACR